MADENIDLAIATIVETSEQEEDEAGNIIRQIPGARSADCRPWTWAEWGP